RALENTMPRFGYLATLFFLLIGLFAAVNISLSLEGIPTQVHRIGFSYVFLLIYIGVIAFIVRTHWIPLVAGFVMFENGIFVLAMLLGAGLPIGIEMGAFVDAVLVLVSAAALRMSPTLHDGSEVKS
ncbi:MAG: formate hydrogenase, partial [Leptospira sp.]|nr:formate hydrogenase [Leptospira sp.]